MTSRPYIVLLLGLLVLAPVPSAAAEPDPPEAPPAFVEAPLPASDELGFSRKGAAIDPTGHVNALVVFAQFRDEITPPEPVPDFAHSLLDPEVPGSFSHFYHVMSFGQLEIRGSVLPKRYVSDHPEAAYLARTDDMEGRYGEFVADILAKVDADHDLGQFDNDGDDGIANSGDDDGRVDYVFVLVRSAPRHFLLGNANGKAGLAMQYVSPTDESAAGGYVHVGGQVYDGTILEQRDRTWTVSLMAHEFGHSLGLPDLYDQSFQRKTGLHPSEDGAGIGRWGLMGLGTQGWHDDDGPNPLCAWSLEKLGWVGPDNERLIVVSGDTTGMEVRSIHQGGQIVKVPLPGAKHPNAYLLLSQRSRSGPYDSQLPGTGLLIWHVHPILSNNDDEHMKLLDLVCADGRYTDAGYSKGKAGDGRSGGDNLDFWAHDKGYRDDHAGNEGDATDLFDGVRFRHFGLSTNPSTALPDVHSDASSGLSIRMRRRGEAMVVEIRRPRWAGRIESLVRWQGNIVVEGDITVGKDGTLLVYQPARVRFSSTDRLRSGLDAERVEVRVRGAMRVKPMRGPDGAIVPDDPARFEAETPGTRWLGIIAEDGASTQLFEDSYILVDSEFGEVVSLVDAMQRGADVATAVVDTSPTQEATEFALLPNYPNPFSDRTTLRYTLAEPGPVRLRIYNSLGQQVRDLVDEHLFEGAHEAEWSARDDAGRRVAAGLYVSQLEIPGVFQARDKMMLIAGGYSRVSDLDEELGTRGADWSTIDDALRTPGALLSYARQMSPARAAVRAGQVWVRLEVTSLYHVDEGRAQDAARQLADLVSGIDSTDAAYARLAEDLRQQSALPLVDVTLDRLRQRLEGLLQQRADAAVVHFYLGEWLGGLEMAARAARRLSLPLTGVRDPEADASVARQYRAVLGDLEADQRLLASLEQLAETLATRPGTRGQLRSLVERLERMTR